MRGPVTKPNRDLCIYVTRGPCVVWTHSPVVGATMGCGGKREAHHVGSRPGRPDWIECYYCLGDPECAIVNPDCDTCLGLGKVGVVVCLCLNHHTEGHTSGWKTFERKYALDLATLAEQFGREFYQVHQILEGGSYAEVSDQGQVRNDGQ